MTYHPTNIQLESYATGTIGAVEGLVIATHLETCAKCREAVDSFEHQHALVLESHDSEYDVSMDSILDDILLMDVVSEPLTLRQKATIEVNGKEFTLPKSLSHLPEKMGEWRSYGGKVFSSTIDLGEEERVNLLYIGEDVQVPQHSHKGMESTLVLHGSFSDEGGEYVEGDYLFADGSTKHSPQTKPGQDCLCLTVLTEPMVFTQGVARVFNLFGRGMYP
ncbi:ChrR family anti-sigma-E factor [Vibrio maerlii]|uniref:ChrR family anti-sigma-E factor n=1 Tax=Vibrio maerlii TaxID=2231648 RepID=UPI000E3B81A3|nr:ChrR family anti-sigma-E factor [Vibrio maerlii]